MGGIPAMMSLIIGCRFLKMIGHFSDLVNERVDLVAGAIVLTFNRSLV